MSELREASFHSVVTAIHEHERFLVATHVRPDGDAIGSLLALTFMLRKLGKTADPFCQDPVPPGQKFLPGSEMVQHGDARLHYYDAAVLVDCGEFMRVGPKLAESVRRIPFLMSIDHHVGNTPFGDVCWVEPSASSTCEMLYDLSLQLPVPLDQDIASQLYTGLLTDTGSFRFSNTNRRVLEIATCLVSAGAQPAFIAQQVYDSTTPGRLHLLARVLSTVAFDANNRLATGELTRRMFVETDTSVSDTEGFIDHLRSVKSVEMAVMFREEADGVVHISMRSKGSVDVAAFAHRYEGGGHRHAAACRLTGSLKEVRAKFTHEALSYLS